jgi:photosystem II stability/assembly factor-like uncharacterized protein
MRKKNIICFLLFLTLNSSLFIFNSFAQWIQQSVPVTGGTFNDMKFASPNTGFIINWNYPVATLLRTTNSGYNWQTMNNWGMAKIFIVDSSCIYTSGYNNGKGIIYRTTNSGNFWDSLISSTTYYYNNLHYFNRDTGLISSGDTYDNQIWRTTNGGQTLQIIAQFGGATSGKFFFLKEKVNGEYYGWYYYANNNSLFVTTNGGINWFSEPLIPENVSSIFFINKDTGWATAYWERNYVFYTTNGGNNWINISLPNSAYCFDIVFSNSRKGWISGNSNNKIFATDNGGNYWGYQNTGGNYSTNMFFLDSLNGWVKSSFNVLSHTTNGGGPITNGFTNYQEITGDFKLNQNYPNPFNNSTIISYQLSISGIVNLKVFEISGKEITTLVNKNQNAGKYEVTFNSGLLSSGIYFYRISINNEKIQVKKMIINK